MAKRPDRLSGKRLIHIIRSCGVTGVIRVDHASTRRLAATVFEHLSQQVQEDIRYSVEQLRPLDWEIDLTFVEPKP